MNDSIELRHLRAFLAVADRRHFGRAAEDLGITQPPLSNQIMRLERAIGCTLFHRRPAVSLTEAGAALMEFARRALREAELGAVAAKRAEQGEIGRLAVGFVPSTMLSILPAITKNFVLQHPEVHLVLTELSSLEQVDALKNGDIHIGFLREPPKEDGFDTVPLLCEPFVAVLPKHHRLADQAVLAPANLAREPFILFPRRIAPTIYDEVLAVCRAGDFTPRVVQEAHEWLTVVGLVEAGLGISLVPQSFGKLRWGGVRYLTIEPCEVRTTTVVCLHREQQSATARSFLELASSMARQREREDALRSHS